MNVLVLLNAAAGTLVASTSGDEAERIARRFADRGHAADVRSVPGDQLADVTRAARDSGKYDLIVAGGGDGTLNTVAAQLVDSAVAFGVLPLGTFNHLALELGLPLDLDGAVDALADGRTVGFSVGRVNDQIFLLFSAVGLYSDVVRHRDAQRKVLGRKKMWAYTVAFFKMLTRWPLMRVRLVPTDGTPPVKRLTPAVLVALSDYQIRRLGAEDFSCTHRRSLNFYLARRTSRIGMIWLVLKGFARRVRPPADFDVVCTPAADLRLRRRHTRVAIDGEVIDLPAPLKYEVLRDALRMRVPAAYAEREDDAPRPPDRAEAPATAR
ncbi:MAG TPA: diacylglycerol kinase family protein [Tepidisphaeraceae bacterium]|nr:diacylglycerol kinase family protein [Tepidisphaeraceae bacterium]